MIMSETEFNNLTFDNIKETTNFSPDNISTSDELLAPETYDYERPTNFSKLKSKIKVAKIAFFTITVSVTGGAIVVGLVQNNIGAKPPVIEQPNFRVENKQLIYSFKVSDVRNYKVIFTINQNDTNIYKVVFDKNDTYENSYDLSEYSGSLNAKIDYTNEVDHSGNLYTFNFNL